MCPPCCLICGAMEVAYLTWVKFSFSWLELSSNKPLTKVSSNRFWFKKMCTYHMFFTLEYNFTVWYYIKGKASYPHHSKKQNCFYTFRFSLWVRSVLWYLPHQFCLVTGQRYSDGWHGIWCVKTRALEKTILAFTWALHMLFMSLYNSISPAHCN